jgi:hypothetical protein
MVNMFTTSLRGRSGSLNQIGVSTVVCHAERVRVCECARARVRMVRACVRTCVPACLCACAGHGQRHTHRNENRHRHKHRLTVSMCTLYAHRHGHGHMMEMPTVPVCTCTTDNSLFLQPACHDLQMRTDTSIVCTSPTHWDLVGPAHVLQKWALLRGAHVRPTLEAAKLHLHLESRQPSRPSHENAAENGAWRLSQTCIGVQEC